LTPASRPGGRWEGRPRLPYENCMKITPKEFTVLADYIRDLTGIALDQNKVYLAETRLSNLAEALKCTSFSELHLKARADASGSVAGKIIDAITNKETLWFRDTSPFALFQHKILPELIDRRFSGAGNAGKGPIHVWSAACSTGQEVYSLTMVIRDLLPDWSRYNIKILGTDIADEAIARASYGQYQKFEMERGLPRDKLEKYFVPGNGNFWKIKDELRAMATFRKHNLLAPSFASLGRFDVILCRNVAIYFTPEEKAKLFLKIAQILQPDGYLIIGASESLMGVSDAFEPKRHLNAVYYQLKNRSSLPAAGT
jgi:chemotaxis protein methyltransferase CheR